VPNRCAVCASEQCLTEFCKETGSSRSAVVGRTARGAREKDRFIEICEDLIERALAIVHFERSLSANRPPGSRRTFLSFSSEQVCLP
jgi:hypothetical protein